MISPLWAKHFSAMFYNLSLFIIFVQAAGIVKKIISVMTFLSADLPKKINIYINQKFETNAKTMENLFELLLALAFFASDYMTITLFLIINVFMKTLGIFLINFDNDIKDLKILTDNELITLSASMENDLCDTKGKYIVGETNVKI